MSTDPHPPAGPPGSDRPEQTARSVANAKSHLFRLNEQVESMRAVLVRLLQEVASAEAVLERDATARLVEVNAELVMAALDSQAEAAAAQQALAQAQQSNAVDLLTGLPNRAALQDRFSQVQATARRNGTSFAVLFVDLDNFKRINDTHGHALGDEALRLAAERMVAAVRAADTVSRHGGDEFVIVLAELGRPEDAQAVAAKLSNALSVPAVLRGRPIQLIASVGIAIFPEGGEDLDSLIAHADAAMFETKRRHPGGIAVFGQAEEPGSADASIVTPPVADLSEAQRRLMQLRSANEHLVLATVNAQELRDAAERARQRQADLMAAVAEELANPRAPIRIAAAMLGMRPADEPLLTRVRSIVEQQMTHLSRVVGHLAAAPTGDAPGPLLAHVAVDMSAIIERAEMLQRPIIAARGQRLESHRPPGRLEVTGDAAALELVVSNLLDNASRFTHDGGRITSSVTADADSLTMTLSDNGIGIPQAILAQVFEPFEQDLRALGLNGVGPGIGLTVTRALVLAHGGRLRAHSRGPGLGSQFVLELPRLGGPPPR